LSREELEALARDESVEVRTKLTLLSLSDVSLLGAIKAIQASDQDRAVVDTLDGWLRTKSVERFNQGTPLTPYLDAFERRWLHPSYPLRDSEVARTGADFVRAFLLDPEGMLRITRLAVERNDAELIRRIAFDVDWSGRKEDNKPRASTAPLDDDLFERLLRATSEVLDVNGFRGVRQSLAKRDVPRDEAFLRILRDRSAPRRLRLVAAEAMAKIAGASFEQGLLDVLVEPSWKERGLELDEEELLREIARHMETDARERVLVRAVRAREAADEPILQMLGFYQNQGHQVSAPLALAVLGRWPGVPEKYYQLFAKSVAGLGPATPDNVRRILDAFDEQKLALPAVQAMGRLRDTAFLEPLGRLLRSDVDVVTPYADRRQLQVAAARALANYFSDEAAELLLVGAASTDEEVRKACFDALETIRRYQDEKGRWATRRSGESARASAVLEVLPLLDDRDPMIRAQAARSLATLDAVEQLPRLLALLKDGAPVVRDAAQEAIDRLNAVKR
jgi:HEAT repeat protein